MRYFRVKNFERFQHYKDRSPPWIKLYNDLLDDYAFTCLQDASKLHQILIWLVASRTGNKLPADPDWISRKISATEPVDLDVLERAGFIEYIDEKLNDNQPLRDVEQHASGVLADCKQDACLEGEQSRAEGDYCAKACASERFAEFWAAYPKKRSKGQARKAWAKLNPDEQLLTRILDAVERAKTSGDWAKDGGKFIPYPATWLNAEGWLDEVQPAAPKPSFRDVN